LAAAAANRGDHQRATELAEERLRLAHQAGDPKLIVDAYSRMAMQALEQGQHERAAELLESARRGFEQVGLGDDDVIAALLRDSGRAAGARGALSEALQHYADSLSIFQKLGDVWGIGDCLYGIASALRRLGKFEPGARLMGTVAAIQEQHGLRLGSRLEARQLQAREAARAALGADRFDALMHAGRALAMTDAIAEALNMVRSLSAAFASQERTGTHADTRLTPREVEVATLIARGRSNQRIAQDLVIAPSTAERHVANILRKLDLTSRTQVAAWFIERKAPTTLP
jgi:DNA-binding CsgD family transcriptional regulator